MKITEVVSPAHPDKIADRIAGALVDYCYANDSNPKCAFEVLIGHGACYVTGETSVHIPDSFVKETAERISSEVLDDFKYVEVPQDTRLANAQNVMCCGDNGVFAGYPMPHVHKWAKEVCIGLYQTYPFDGKIVLNGDTGDMTVCWSNTSKKELEEALLFADKINPLGEWTGGTNVDTGVTGRKLASDFYGIEYPLGGGTLHGKDLSKADCSVNIFCFVLAQVKKTPVKGICSIGDTEVNIDGVQVPFTEIVTAAKEYVNRIGGFEKLAEWGLL